MEDTINIVIYSNCQGNAIKALLNEKLLCNYYQISNYQYFNKPNNLPFEILKSADIFIFQFTNKSHGICSTDPNSDNNIFSFLKKDCIKIGIPSIFQSSFWPIIPNFGSCTDGHEIIIELKKKKSLNEILELYDDNKIDFKINERFDKCESHTKEIEQYYLDSTSLIIIPITDFIRNYYKNYRLFMTHCHPSIYIYLHIVNKIIKIINNKIYEKDKIQCFENIFKYEYDYRIKYLRPDIQRPNCPEAWCDSKYIIKELDVKYITHTNEDIVKNHIKSVFNH